MSNGFRCDRCSEWATYGEPSEYGGGYTCIPCLTGMMETELPEGNGDAVATWAGISDEELADDDWEGTNERD